ncbi:GNAT family N-acetyltransferase [Actibacterium sp. 188UL27-1]|uniref:GNAT family N-acetyltransferase n=1 Tax=Actibacterium sp. 188UL27-1 TaxID=2786961 RepID=UPI0019599B15|nr:GNAT family N-acetyltransferase [Actibacterium sp. 188UL27-1]MBM7066244.1 GNAT family N-acetyltransferase [Actibacterium sp. 188UL27-1]
MNDIAARIPVLSTDRLLLRAPARADFDAYAATMMSDRAHFMGGPFDLRDARAAFAIDTASWVTEGFGCWSLTRHGDQTFLGSVGLTQPDNYPEPELGWFVQPEAEGQGIAFEAATAARDWAFATLTLDSFVSYIDPPNTRSRALAERLGATIDPDASRPDPGDVVYRHRRPD